MPGLIYPVPFVFLLFALSRSEGGVGDPSDGATRFDPYRGGGSMPDLPQALQDIADELLRRDALQFFILFWKDKGEC